MDQNRYPCFYLFSHGWFSDAIVVLINYLLSSSYFRSVALKEVMFFSKRKSFFFTSNTPLFSSYSWKCLKRCYCCCCCYCCCWSHFEETEEIKVLLFFNSSSDRCLFRFLTTFCCKKYYFKLQILKLKFA